MLFKEPVPQSELKVEIRLKLNSLEALECMFVLFESSACNMTFKKEISFFCEIKLLEKSLPN